MISCKSVFGIWLVGLFAISLSLDAAAQERTWSSSNGKFKVTGELIERAGTDVKIKRSDNGKVITVPVEKLSEADQQFLDSAKLDGDSSGSGTKNDDGGSGTKKGDDVAPEKKMEANLKVAGKSQWSEFPFFDSDGKKEPLDLQLNIEAKGDMAATAIYYGMVKITKLEADGKAIKTKKDKFSFNSPEKNFIKVERSENSFFNKHPKDGVRLTLDFEHPENKLKAFTAVEGEFKIRTGGKRESTKIENALAMAGKEIENEKLKSLSIKAEIKQDESMLVLELEGDLQPVYDVKLVDKKGKKPDKLMGNGWSGSDKIANYSFQFQDEEIADDLVLQISLATDMKEMTVPFKLKDVAVPAEK